MNKTDSIPNLTLEQEQQAFHGWIHHQSISDRDLIIHSYRKLVYKIAKQYYAYYGVDIDELISEGNLGLLRALKTFAIARGNRFSTYASFWIRAYIQQYIHYSFSIVRRTQHHLRMMQKYNQVCLKNLQTFNQMMMRDVSLNKKVSEDHLDSFIELLADQRENQEEVVISNNYRTKQKELFQTAFEQLKTREQEVIRRRYLQDKHQTLQEIANELKLTMEGVRQIEKRAIQKLQKSIQNLDKT